MSNSSVSLYFDDYNESYFLIRFGKKEYLEEIQSGKIRFSTLMKYRSIENNNIGDMDEGLTSIHYTDDNTKILYSHPCINNGKAIDVTGAILSIRDYPNTNIYISCFSYFTAKDVFDKNIFSDSILEEKEWDSVLFILDTKEFIENIKKSLIKYVPVFHKVQYLDYNINQENLNAFSKSSKFEHQKEFRCAFKLVDEANSYIKRIDSETIEVCFESVKSVIIPTKEFREGFYLQ